MPEALIIGAVVVGWLGCGAVAQAMIAHDFERLYSASPYPHIMRDRFRREDIRVRCMLIFLGPLSLSISFLMSDRPYGLRWF